MPTCEFKLRNILAMRLSELNMSLMELASFEYCSIMPTKVYSSNLFAFKFECFCYFISNAFKYHKEITWNSSVSGTANRPSAYLISFHSSFD